MSTTLTLTTLHGLTSWAADDGASRLLLLCMLTPTKTCRVVNAGNQGDLGPKEDGDILLKPVDNFNTDCMTLRLAVAVLPNIYITIDAADLVDGVVVQLCITICMFLSFC